MKRLPIFALLFLAACADRSPKWKIETAAEEEVEYHPDTDVQVANVTVSDGKTTVIMGDGQTADTFTEVTGNGSSMNVVQASDGGGRNEVTINGKKWVNGKRVQ